MKEVVVVVILRIMGMMFGIFLVFIGINKQIELKVSEEVQKVLSNQK